MTTNKQIHLSSEFRKYAVLSIISILIFLISYLILLTLALGITIAGIYAGIAIVILHPNGITIAAGLGLISFGVLILVFLLKFLTQKSKTDRSHLIEIQKKDQPELFELIQNIVYQVGTDFPKRVYFSNDVNASVFYDSGFWSMFLPVRKNLMIGMGLINTVTKDELKAILSHEFGHFSQKSMKVGSYVYNVNKVIHNLLYDNESFENSMRKLMNAGSIFAVFTLLAGNIIRGIQFILRVLYSSVNKSYMALSREMEFHADEVAANITGFAPLKSSLLRLNLADSSYNDILSFYDTKITENIRSENIYPEHQFVINFLAEENNIPIVDNLPDIQPDTFDRFNQSKLVIKDQWASHPETAERIDRLEKTEIIKENRDKQPAYTIINDLTNIQKNLTNELFNHVSYEQEPQYYSIDQFVTSFKENYYQNRFPVLFNGYYDHKNPSLIDFDRIQPVQKEEVTFTSMFSNDMIDLVYQQIALQNDLQIIRQIRDKLIPIKTFDYDGQKYKRKEAKYLVTKIEPELIKLDRFLSDNDQNVYQYFRKIENASDHPSQLAYLYRSFNELDENYNERYAIYTQLIEGLQFVHIPTDNDDIIINFSKIRPLEKKLKSQITEMLNDPKQEAIITTDCRENFEKYVSGNLEYYSTPSYLDGNLQVLFSVLNKYIFVLNKSHFLAKKSLLDYMEKLQNENTIII